VEEKKTSLKPDVRRNPDVSSHPKQKSALKRKLFKLQNNLIIKRGKNYEN